MYTITVHLFFFGAIAVAVAPDRTEAFLFFPLDLFLLDLAITVSSPRGDPVVGFRLYKRLDFQNAARAQSVQLTLAVR